MRYLKIDVGTWSKEPLPWWCRVLQKIIPAANPDLEKYYDETRVWWLEINDNGEPQREIGFDINGNPIVLGPIGNNYGFLVDSSDDWNDSKEDSDEAAKNFDQQWAVVWNKFKHLDKESR
jgi:hypothetical protein